jgi:hypothetical protein
LGTPGKQCGEPQVLPISPLPNDKNRKLNLWKGLKNVESPLNVILQWNGTKLRNELIDYFLAHSLLSPDYRSGKALAGRPYGSHDSAAAHYPSPRYIVAEFTGT